MVYFGGCHPEAGPLVRQMREQGVRAKFFSGDCVVTEELVTAAGGPQFTNGVLMTFGKDPRTIPEGKAVIDKFRASGFEPEGYTLYAYASIQAIAAAYNAAGTDNAKSQRMAEKPQRRYRDGEKKARDGKGDLKVSDYVVYQWDDKGKISSAVTRDCSAHNALIRGASYHRKQQMLRPLRLLHLDWQDGSYGGILSATTDQWLNAWRGIWAYRHWLHHGLWHHRYD